MTSVITIKNLQKSFIIPHERRDTLKEHFTGFFKKRDYENFNALNDISCSIKKGDFIGIIGANGSGKSTLLKILAGIYTPTKGSINIQGKLSPFLELGVGFNPELSGKENIFLNAAVLGLSKKEILKRYQSIVNFSELERFMDMKVKNYSSGMFVRLAFSVAIQVDADILLMDEVLAVGDSQFQEKCFRVFRQLKEQKKTIVFVSHAMGSVEEFCNKVIYLKNGKLKMFGPTERVIQEYRKDILQEEEANLEKENKNIQALHHILEEEHPTEEEAKKESDTRWGSGEFTVENCILLNNSHKQKYTFTEDDEFITIKVNHKCHSTINNPVFGIKLANDSDIQQIATNTFVKNIRTGKFQSNGKITVEYIIPNVFPTGTYHISCAIASSDTNIFYDWREKLVTFSVNKQKETYGTLDLPHTIKIS